MPSDEDIPYVDRRRLRWNTDADSLLGQGSFGRVYCGTYDGAAVAIKVIRPPDADEDRSSEEFRNAQNSAMRQHRREMHRFRVVRNPNIITCFGVFRERNPRDLYIVTEYLEGGSLHDSLTKMRAREALLDDRSFLQIASHMAFGLNHVHSQSYTHGDMKPQNVLLTAEFQFHKHATGRTIASLAHSAKAKIADFGLSKRLEGAEPSGLLGSTGAGATSDFGNGPCGTFLYMSPEAYLGVSKLSDADAKASDVYAYGLVLFELLTGMQSWCLERVRNPIQLHILVRDGQRPSWGERKPFINPEYIKLVEHCWKHAPAERPTLEEIVRVVSNLKHERTVRAAANYVSDISAPNSATSSEKKNTNQSSQFPYQAVKETQDSDVYDHENEHWNEVQSPDSLAANGHRPTITHVPSMRKLTESEERSNLLRQTDRDRLQEDTSSLDFGDSITDAAGFMDNRFQQEKKLESADKSKVMDESLVVEPTPDVRSGQEEIDQSFVGGQQVIRVQSINEDPPMPEPLPFFDVPNGDEKSTMGLGSVAENHKTPSQQENRSASDVLKSFVNAAGFGQFDNQDNGKRAESGDRKTSPPTGMRPAMDHEQPQDLKHVERRTGVAEPPPISSGRDDEKYVAGQETLQVGTENDFTRKNGGSKRSYNSPVEECASVEDMMKELNENDTKSLNDCEDLFARPGRQVSSRSAGHHIPTFHQNPPGVLPTTRHSQPLRPDLSQRPGRAPLRYPGNSVYLPPSSSAAGLAGPQLPDSSYRYRRVPGSQPLSQIPKTPFHDLANTETLQLACSALEQRNQSPAEIRDSDEIRQLCSRIGNIARNASAPIDHKVVLRTLRVILSTMYHYRQSLLQNRDYSVRVFASCNFALCNLFKLCNVIAEQELRTKLAEWIAYSISWNVFQDGITQGPHLDSLSYTATAAARNFMWMNEDNVIAFTSQTPCPGALATSRLVSSMNFFDPVQGRIPNSQVLEASLSALAMIVHFPQQRLAFMNVNGVQTLMEMLHRHIQNPKISALIFAMVTVLLSGPVQNQEEKESLGKGFIRDNGCNGLVSALDQVRQKIPYDLESLKVLQQGCTAMLAAARFSELLRANVVNASMASVLFLVQWLATCSLPPGYNEDEIALRRALLSLGVTLCELILELGKERAASEFVRQMQIPFKRLLHVHGQDTHFANSCRQVLTTLF